MTRDRPLAAAVEADYATALARIAATHHVEPPKTILGRSGTGLPLDPLAPRAEATQPMTGGKRRGHKRNEHRHGRTEDAPQQARLPQANPPRAADLESADGTVDTAKGEATDERES